MNTNDMKDTTQIHLGEWLKSQMDLKQVDFDMVAEHLGCDRSTIFRWTQKADADVKKVKKVMDFLNIDMRESFTNVDHLYKKDTSNYKMKYFSTLEKLMEVREEFEEYKRNHPE